MIESVFGTVLDIFIRFNHFKRVFFYDATTIFGTQYRISFMNFFE